jgi:hypothetical protein
MEASFMFMVAVIGLVIAGCMVWTWIVVHQAASEAREWFARQNIAARIEDAEDDALIEREAWS